MSLLALLYRLSLSVYSRCINYTIIYIYTDRHTWTNGNSAQSINIILESWLTYNFLENNGQYIKRVTKAQQNEKIIMFEYTSMSLYG